MWDVLVICFSSKDNMSCNSVGILFAPILLRSSITL
jgi:hypothetical protein